MQVNRENAVMVAALFDALSDARFNLRTADAVKRNLERRLSLDSNATVPSGEDLLALATEVGCPILHRNRDGLPLIAKPVTADGTRRLAFIECRAISDRAEQVARGNAEPFDLATYRPTFMDAPAAEATDETDGQETEE